MAIHTVRAQVPKGRGTGSSLQGRFARIHYESTARSDADRPVTRLWDERVASIITRNTSPDVPFDRSINPYRGCEHGCIYCYARPSHSFLDLSPGLDFETEIMVKSNAAKRLREQLASRSYRCRSVTIGANTDPYQPAEKQRRISRALLEVLAETRHPFSIITKSHLVERDLDIIERSAAMNLCSVAISIPTMQEELKRRLEPRVPSARRRLKTIERLSASGVPVTLMLAPVIPALTDHEMERILEAAADAGARRAVYVLLRLPHEVAPLFSGWLRTHYPDRAGRIMSLVRQSHGGSDYNPAWGRRQTGTGHYAELISNRFALAARRTGLDREPVVLDTSSFRRPSGENQLFLDL